MRTEQERLLSRDVEEDYRKPATKYHHDDDNDATTTGSLMIPLQPRDVTTPLAKEEMSAPDKRKAIQTIRQDRSLSRMEKNRRIQQIMGSSMTIISPPPPANRAIMSASPTPQPPPPAHYGNSAEDVEEGDRKPAPVLSNVAVAPPSPSRERKSILKPAPGSHHDDEPTPSTKHSPLIDAKMAATQLDENEEIVQHRAIRDTMVQDQSLSPTERQKENHALLPIRTSSSSESSSSSSSKAKPVQIPSATEGVVIDLKMASQQEDEDDATLKRREEIREIMADNSLTTAEKQQRIQSLFRKASKEKDNKTQAAAYTSTEDDDDYEEDRKPAAGTDFRPNTLPLSDLTEKPPPGPEPAARPGVAAVKEDDGIVSRKLQNSMTAIGFNDNVQPSSSSDQIRPGAVSVRGEDSRVSRKAGRSGSPIGKRSVAVSSVSVAKAIADMSSTSFEPVDLAGSDSNPLATGSSSSIATPGAVFVQGHDSRVVFARKTRRSSRRVTTNLATADASATSIAPVDFAGSDNNPLATGSSSSITTPGAVFIQGHDFRVARKTRRSSRRVSTNLESSTSLSLDLVADGTEPSGEPPLTTNSSSSASMPGSFTTMSGSDSRIARKMAASASHESSRRTSIVGSVQATAEDDCAAQSKSRGNESFVVNDLFRSDDDGSREINADDYLRQQVQAMNEDRNQKGTKCYTKKNKHDVEADAMMGRHGDAAVPSLPGAFSVKQKKGKWFTGGFVARSREWSSSRRSKADRVVDADVEGVRGENRTWWDRVDKPTVAVGACILVGVLLAICIPIALVASAPPSPTPSPTSPRLGLYDDFRETAESVSGRSPFEDDQSAQSKALDWIVFEDELRIEVDDPTFVQRYSLMVMYFGQHGENWRYVDVRWGEGVSECDWDFTDCLEDDIVKMEMSDVNMVGTVLPELGKLSKLTYLDLSRNALEDGEFPSVLATMTSLKELYLESTGMRGALPDTIGDLRALEGLALDNNDLLGSVPTTMKRLTSMKKFYISETRVKGNIMDFASAWPSLEVLDAQNNRLSGSIPTAVSALSNLVSLKLHTNEMSGTVPSELGRLTLMKRFAFGGGSRHRQGPIPTELGRWTDLEVLSIHRSRLVGPLPTELGNLVSLGGVNLQGNELTGTLPSELGRWTAVSSLFLNQNDFTGTVPTELGNISLLAIFHLERNEISGTMPEELCSLVPEGGVRGLLELWADCGGNNPDIECEFPECCSNCISTRQR